MFSKNPVLSVSRVTTKSLMHPLHNFPSTDALTLFLGNKYPAVIVVVRVEPIPLLYCNTPITKIFSKVFLAVLTSVSDFSLTLGSGISANRSQHER